MGYKRGILGCTGFMYRRKCRGLLENFVEKTVVGDCTSITDYCGGYLSHIHRFPRAQDQYTGKAAMSLDY